MCDLNQITLSAYKGSLFALVFYLENNQLEYSIECSNNSEFPFFEVERVDIVENNIFIIVSFSIYHDNLAKEIKNELANLYASVKPIGYLSSIQHLLKATINDISFSIKRKSIWTEVSKDKKSHRNIGKNYLLGKRVLLGNQVCVCLKRLKAYHELIEVKKIVSECLVLKKGTIVNQLNSHEQTGLILGFNLWLYAFPQSKFYAKELVYRI